MRTTFTLPDDLVQKAKDATGKTRVSEAVAMTLQEHFALKKRLALIEELLDKPVPHKWKQIKRARRNRKWSS